MNKKGFTLVELMAVVTLLAIVVMIAVPNIMKLVNKSRYEQVLSDAKNFIADIKYKSKKIEYEEYFPKSIGDFKEICSNHSLFNDTLKEDPYGNYYEGQNSCVKVEKTIAGFEYSIKLASKNGAGEYFVGISTNDKSIDYVKESDLSISSVIKYDID